MDTVREIEAAINGTGPIPAEHVRKWMKDRDLEAQGAVAHLITYPPQCDRIEPTLDEDDYEAFLPRYYEVCLRRDPEGEWVDTRYGVAWQIVDWFNTVPDEDDVDDYPFLAFLRDWMAEVYKEGEDEVREALVQGVLSHILEDGRWRPFFAGWRDDPVLKEAIDAAMEWAVENEKESGTSD